MGDLDVDRVEEWTDGSRVDERATGAARTVAQYLGTTAIIADAEALGISLAWDMCGTVAPDNQGVIQRIHGLALRAPRSWIEERLVRQMAKRPRVLLWVKGHDGVEVNEAAGSRAKEKVWRGERMHWPDIVTPPGIRQAFPLHSRAPDHLKWSIVALRGLTYLVTDKGPQRQWLKEMGKVEDPSCICDGWTPQNAAHLYLCPWVGDGIGRPKEQASKDEWCAAVTRFVQ